MAKRGRNLAALAALGALGYMATRGGKQSGEGVPVEDRGDMLRRPAVASAAASPDTSDDDRDVGGGFSPAGLRRNTETGEMYDPGTVKDSAPTKRPVVSSSPRIEAPAQTAERVGAMAMGQGRRAAPSGSTASTRAGTMGGYVSRAGTRAGPSAQAQFEAADRAARTPEAVAARQAQIEGQALGRVSPEEYLGPGAGLKGAAALAKKLASYTPKSKAGKEMMQEQISMTDVPRLAGPPKGLPAPRPAPKGDASQTVRGGRTRFNEDEVGLEFKRGGKVKKMASGGSTSSGYHRGDGIAQRGKTKGRMY